MRYLRMIGAAAALATAVTDAAHAQTAPPAATPLVIGQTFTLESKALGETRRINVYLPPAYTDSATVRLPVLYMPDGGIGEDFLHVAGLVQVLTGNGTMRPFILVGIENTQRRRDLTGPTTVAEDRKIAPKVGGSAAYRQFIREELMPQVKQRYRTTAETAIVGESLAGLFVFETLLLEPQLFNTYLAFDPSLWWNNGQLAAQASTLLQKSRPAATVYLATSIHGDTAATRRLMALARPQATRLGSWHYEPMPEETHATIYHPAALRAFRAVFKPKASSSH
ncbi:alpha/beta hydrolase-fold protein [Hymenobacter sp. DH14]|uniref:Alpha/beta hydrolase-fold protein n=1 Tax=Hymenobacter cyanobacteriorum TaxID=2926463 RepID=A0A9X2AE01_9BACT|nr:alpha/beta hydrolase-fold protein [Hymenobacter cyanobacteriorum]MCI1186262.1 alpha/beta hydrolase-fold protein [Hymenobacter cyanobacteriorum]